MNKITIDNKISIEEVIERETQTLMFDRFNSDTEDGIAVSTVKEIVKNCMKAQRELCADKIKDWNFTLAEIVRTSEEPKEIEEIKERL